MKNNASDINGLETDTEVMTHCLDKLTSDLWYSVRRYYVDTFFFRHIENFSSGQSILDMGGKKTNKRGEFDIEKYDLDVKYANLDEATNPDYACDLVAIPVGDNSFDGVILSEVLEHVPEPVNVLREASRVLNPGGKLLICTPFMFPVHADPYDFGRYTDYWFQIALDAIGFQHIHIEKQGLFFSVLANMLKTWGYQLEQTGRPSKSWKKGAFHRAIFWVVKNSFIWEKNPFYREHNVFAGYTTGYGIVCEKPIA